MLNILGHSIVRISDSLNKWCFMSIRHICVMRWSDMVFMPRVWILVINSFILLNTSLDTYKFGVIYKYQCHLLTLRNKNINTSFLCSSLRVSLTSCYCYNLKQKMKAKIKNKTLHSIRHRTGYFWQNKIQLSAELCIVQFSWITIISAQFWWLETNHMSLTPWFDFLLTIKFSQGEKIYTWNVYQICTMVY